MLTKEQLLSVPELKLAGKIALTSDAKFAEYLATVNTFIDQLPSYSDKMQSAADSESFNVVSQQVNSVCNLLNRIYAEDLSHEYKAKFEKLLNAPTKDATAIEALVENFILAVASLSLDIQMAAKRAPRVGGTPPPSASPSPSGRPSAAPQARPSAPSRGGYGKTLILAVDNAVIFLNTLKRLLENEPYEVHCCTSGAEALEFIKTNRPDIYLLDIEMPGMDGYELARRINSTGFSAPIVFVTANSSRECVNRASEVGAVGMLMKPLRQNQLMAKLHEHLR
jgi:CheY-like chemotaxis protein